MKTLRITLILFLVGLTVQVWAQPPGGGRRPEGAGPRIELAPGTGGLVGRVQDAMTEEGIEFANVLVYKAGSDEMVSGITTDERGVFIIKDLAFADYDVEISYLGYETMRKEGLQVTEETPLGRVGRLSLSSGSSTLEEVEVTAERAAVEFGLDRRVFNVEKDVASSGGTAEDLLRNIPSITVDLDGNISLRGSANVNILINGKPSSLTGMGRQAFLQQISAASIQSVEVLTNPSAKYNPEGMAGIINIITKRQNRQGFNVQTSINLGTNDKYNGNVDLNYRVGKFNFQTGYSFNDDSRWFRGERFRTTNTADTTWFQEQDINGDRRRRSHTVRGGVEYFLSTQGSITLSGSYADQFGEDASSRDNLFLLSDRSTSFSSFRQEIGGETGSSYEVMLDYRQRFQNEGQELVFTAQRSQREEDEREDFQEDFFDADEMLLSTDRQENPQIDDNARWLLQTDYTHPISENLKMETGLRASIRDVNIDNQLFDYDPEEDRLLLVESLSNTFSFDEDIYSAYFILGGSAGDWEWQTGLRAEQTNTTASLLSPEVNAFENDYFSLFPSAFLTYNLNDNTGIQASYSRRINRPRFRSLNPFIDYSDPLNPRGGNPYLLPEFVNSFELNYIKTTNFGSVTIGGYFREINDIITRISEADPATGVNFRTQANLNSGRNYGLEVIGTLRPTKNWQLVVSGNAYRTQLDGSNLEADLNADGYLFRGRLQSNWTILKDLGIQLTGFYRSGGVTAQGESRALYSVDVGLRKPILNKKGAITLRVTDIFNARRWSFVTENNGIIDDATFQRESRIAYLGFTYSLRQDKRRGNNRRRGEGGGDDVEF